MAQGNDVCVGGGKTTSGAAGRGEGFFVVGFVCACCYLGADCLCGLPFSCDVFDVKMKMASHNNEDHCTRQ